MNYKYNKGDLLGPNNILMLDRLRKNNKNQWIGLFECPLCKTPFEARIDSVVCGDKKTCGCRRGNSKDITNQQFGRLTALYPTKKKAANGITFWHCKCQCGREKDIRITSLLNGSTTSCGCYRTELKMNDLTNKTFGLLTVIENTNKKDNAGYFIWKCKCNCGNICEVNSRSLISGNTKSCGLCKNNSLKEKEIAKLLDEMNIEYIQQKTFNNCINPKTNRLLRFDFFLPKYNCCIEYDGKQHFQVNDYFGGIEAFNDTKYRDNVKNNYCQLNNIKLFRINYLNIIDKDFLMKGITR